EQYQKLQSQIGEWKPSGVLECYNDLSIFKRRIIDHLCLHIQQNTYIHNNLNNLNIMDIKNPNLLKHRNEMSERMLQLILGAGERESEIQFLQNIDSTQLHAGDLHLNLNSQREISQWKTAITDLKKSGFINDLGNNGRLYELTGLGWNTFDQLKAQSLENN